MDYASAASAASPDRLDRASQLEWQLDQVTTRAGVVIPVRATARRPLWGDLPDAVHDLINSAAGAQVVEAESVGTGFTPGFASRLRLQGGRDIFVKAASASDDELHGWPLSDAYRDEVRKLTYLPAGIGAPTLLWHRDVELAGIRWIVMGFEYVDGAPPRRPWQSRQLHLVLDKLAAIAPALRHVPPQLELEGISEHLVAGFDARLELVRESVGDSEWLDTVEQLCEQAAPLLDGTSIVHMDLRDDNVLLGRDETVWFVDWNWPIVGAPWIDTMCLLLSAYGDGRDVEPLLREHPLTCDVEPRAIDSLLAVLSSYFDAQIIKPVPPSSPHLRDHQTWYADAVRDWLTTRLARR